MPTSSSPGSRHVAATVALFVGVVLVSCGTQADTPFVRDAGAVNDASIVDAAMAGGVEPETDVARSVVTRLQAQFTFEAPATALPSADVPVPWSALPSAPVDHVEFAGDHLEPVIQASAGPKGVSGRVEYPLKASGTYRVLDERSGMAVAVQLVGAADVEREVGHGFVTYPSGYIDGADILVRPTLDGSEDYLSFTTAPRDSRVEYNIELPPQAVGLRLVENTLEVLEKEGTPRVRAARPRVVGSDGKVTEATLTVTGCDVDTNPAAPWGRAMTPPGASACRVVVTWDPSAVTYPALMDPSWSSTASMSTARALHTATLLSGSGGNNDILVIGGDTSGTCELFNPTTSTWSTTASAGVTVGHTATLLQNGAGVLVAGGAYSEYFSFGGRPGIPAYHGYAEEAYSSFKVYSPSAGTWSTGTNAGGCSAGNMCNERAFHSATLLSNGSVLVAGGIQYTVEIVKNVPTAFLASLAGAEIYNPSTNSFTSTGSMTTARDSFTLTLLANGKVFAADGEDYVNSTATTLSTFEEFTPSSGTWATVSNSGTTDPRKGSVAFLTASGNIALFGGSSAASNDLIALSSNSALTKYTSPAAATYSAIAQTSGGALLQIGGATSSGVTGMVESYPFTSSNDGSSLTSGTSLPTLVTPRQSHTATAFGDSTGRILVAGGVTTSGQATNSAELYNPCGAPGSSCTLASPNPCMSAPTCNSSGACVQTTPLTGASCTLSSPNVCMGPATCSASGTCAQTTSLPAGTSCGVATCSVCNGSGACNPQSLSNPNDKCVVGACNGNTGVVAWSEINVNDGNPCTVDTCAASTGAVHTNAAAGSFCGTSLCAPSTCVPSGSSMACVPGVPPSTDDGNVCTLNDQTACNSTTGVENVLGRGCGAPQSLLSLPGTTYPGTAPSNIGNAATAIYAGSLAGPAVQTLPTNQPNPFDAARVAILRGRVVVPSASSGDAGVEAATPIQGVAVSVVGHPEYGTTATRGDGWYDIVVNGGGTLTVAFQPPAAAPPAPAYLPVQRTVVTRWKDWTVVDDVLLTAQDVASSIWLDGLVTRGYQWATASAVTDADGTRTARVLFPPGTTTSTTIPNVNLATTPVTVRATEYTVGANGKYALPGTLPPTSAYTYAVELGIDEAQGATVNFVTGGGGATDVLVYIDSTSFLNFQHGSPVPMGSYDPTRGAWAASQHGQIIYVTSSGSSVSVSLDGTQNDDGNPLDFTPALTSGERGALVALNLPTGVTKTFWRIAVPHFSSWDANWGFSPPAGAGGSSAGGPPGAGTCPLCDWLSQFGSIIKPQAQILGEDIPIVGTQYSLHYASDATLGRGVSLTIPWVGTTPMPTSVTNVYLDVTVAGRAFNYTLPPTQLTNQSFAWQWDRNDAYGEFVQGPTVAHIAVGYAYQGQGSYAYTAEFGHFGNGNSISANRQAGEVVIWQYRDVNVGGFDAQPLGFGGWMLSAQHLYDFTTQTLFKGDGGRTEFLNSQSGISSFYAPTYASNGGGGNGVAVGPDGTVFGADSDHIQIWNRAGTTQAQVGVGCCGDASGDGGPPYAAKMNPSGVAVGPDGAIYFGDNYDDQCRIRKVVPDASGNYSTGTISTVVGLPTTQSATCGFSPDGTVATSASIQGTGPMAIGPDGTIYFADTVAGTVRMVTTAGTLSTIAGSSNSSNPAPSLTPQIATGVYLAHAPYALTIDRNGTLYMADGWSEVLALTPDGRVRIVAGTANGGFAGDGGPATSAALAYPDGVAVALDGTIFISDVGNNVVRKVDAGGIITTIAGQHGQIVSPQCQAGANGDGGPAAASTFDVHQAGVALSPDGSLMVANLGGNCGYVVRRISPTPPVSVNIGGTSYNAIVDFGGKEAYVFDALGRHWKTLDTTFGNVLRTFNYDPTTGLLSSIVDRDGTTTIARASGKVTISSPYGQSTVLNVDGTTLSGGYATSIVNPNGETSSMTYVTDVAENGLLATMTDPRFQGAQPPQQHKFGYSGAGLLTSDTDPAAAVRTLSTSILPGVSAQASFGWSVNFTNGGGYSTSYSIQPTAQGGEMRTMVDGPGATTTVSRTLGGLWTTTTPDQTSTAEQWAGDPRFGLAAPFALTSTTTRPSTATAAWSSVIQSTPSTTTPMALASRTTTRKLSGTGIATGTWLDDYESSLMTDVLTTPATSTAPSGRQLQAVVNANGQVTSMSVLGANLEPVTFSYDPTHLDRVTGVTTGDGLPQHGGTRSEVYTYAYSPDTGFMSSTSDPMTRITAFTSRDSVGRVKTTLLPDLSTQINEIFDLDGNSISLTPPGQPAHTFPSYTGVDLLATYQPPPFADGGALLPTTYTYLGDRQLNTETRPDGAVVRSYDPFGRLQSIVAGNYASTYTFVEPTSRVYQAVASGGASPVETDYTYDGSLPTKLAWTQGIPGGPYVDLAYDGLGRLSHADVNGGSAVSYAYAADGLLSQMTSSSNLTITRDPTQTPSGGGEGPSGLIASTTMGAVSDTWGYNWFGEFTDYSATFGSTTYTLSLVRDSLGRVVTKTENGTATSYLYDTLGRLHDVCSGTDTTCATGAIQRTYVNDLNGNRMATPDGSGTVSVDHQDRLISYGSTGYTFTTGGDLATKTDGTGTSTYVYDLQRNLRSVTLPGGVVVTYAVDAMNRRVGRTVTLNGTVAATQYWVYQDGLRPIAELNAAGAVVSVFVYGTRKNVPDYMIQGSKTYRFIVDQVGSVRYVVDTSNGVIDEQISYDEFGNATVESDAATPTSPAYVGFQPFGFAGGLWDRTTGLVRFGSRDYDATTGRWTSKDSELLRAGLNVYAYAANDPLTNIDPSGTDFWKNVLEGCELGATGGFFLGGGCAILAGVGEIVCSPGFAGIGCLGGALMGVLASCPAANDNARPKPRSKSECDELTLECLNNPWQPEWNQGDFGVRKNCQVCQQFCYINKYWNEAACPL